MKNLPNHQVFQPVSFSDVIIDDSFWKPRIDRNRNISLVRQYQQLLRTGSINNFKILCGQTDGQFQGPFFIDSDVYKWMEAVSFTLAIHKEPRLEALLDELIVLLKTAQEADGYLNSYFQLVEPDKKFTNFGACHELYTAGHLILAGIAHYQATHKRALLDIACKAADQITAVFGRGKLEAVDGHAGIEMALFSLFQVTQEERYLNCACFFINERGKTDSRLRWELKHLDEIAGRPGWPGQNNRKYYGTYEDYDGSYAQDHLPVREQNEVVGHAVRAIYLYCGMADLVAETGDTAVMNALESLWHHVTTRRMYLTGGIGPARANEGFTHDFDLPNDTACAESCAAVAMIMWNQRMLNLTGKSYFADLMERILYNGFLVGLSLDGGRYFYYNPLQSSGDCHRAEWYECACCPPNIARLLASLGGYIYALTDQGLVVNLYIQSSVRLKLADNTEIVFRQETNYPWGGLVTLCLELDKPVQFEVKFRVPGWCHSYQLKINHELMEVPAFQGYAAIHRFWSTGDLIEIRFEMPIQLLEANPAIWQDAGRLAIQRGPLIYCIEDVDNTLPINQIMLLENTKLRDRFDPGLLGGIVVIEGEAIYLDQAEWIDTLYREAPLTHQYHKTNLRAVPYYCWDNREPGSMAVWIQKC